MAGWRAAKSPTYYKRGEYVPWLARWLWFMFFQRVGWLYKTCLMVNIGIGYVLQHCLDFLFFLIFLFVAALTFLNHKWTFCFILMFSSLDIWIFFWYEPAEMESLEPTITLKTHPRKPKSSQWMENLDPLRTRFKNLDYIKIKTRWRTCLKNPD